MLIILTAQWNIPNNRQNTNDQFKPIIKQEDLITTEKAVLEKETVYKTLQSKSQIISMQQEISKRVIDIDDSFLGKRVTEFTFNGTYKMGLNISDIEYENISIKDNVIHIELPDPILISLELPYDQLKSEKVKGALRLEMNDIEKKKLYSQFVEVLENEIMNNENIMKQARSNNERVVRELLDGIPNVEGVVFK